MILKKIHILIILLFVPISVSAWTPETCILGPGDGQVEQPPVASDDLSTTGEDRATQWKAFRWKANRSGDAYIFSVRMVVTMPTSTNIDTAYAIYDDNSGTLGKLKVWGYINGRNYYTDPGCAGVSARKCFDLQNVVTNRKIVAGNYYWIAFRSSLGIDHDGYFERAGGSSEPTASWLSKCISSQTADPDDMSETPLPASAYACGKSAGIANNYYGWAVWSAIDGDTTPPQDIVSPSPPLNLRSN